MVEEARSIVQASCNASYVLDSIGKTDLKAVMINSVKVFSQDETCVNSNHTNKGLWSFVIRR